MATWRNAVFCKTGNGVRAKNLKGDRKPRVPRRQFPMGERTKVLMNSGNRKKIFDADEPRDRKAKALIRREVPGGGYEYYKVPFCCVRTQCK